MSEPLNYPDPLDELRFALAEGDAVRPPPRVRDLVLEAAIGARSPGRSSDEVAPITPSEAFGRSIASFDALLTSLSTDEWHCPALRDLDVQRLVGHLIGVELAFLSALDEPGGEQANADHITSTDRIANEQANKSPVDTLRDWRLTAGQTVHRLDAMNLTPEVFDRTVPLHRVHLPLHALLVVRTFELWTHQEDVRRATERPLVPPDAATLRLMTDVAFELLPKALERVVSPTPRGRSRVVLTGPGGRTWVTPSLPFEASGQRSPLQPDVRIVLDSVQFCRLVANRVDPSRVDAIIIGDPGVAQELFTVAAGLALD